MALEEGTQVAVELSRAEKKDLYCQGRLYLIINVYCIVATPDKMTGEPTTAFPASVSFWGCRGGVDFIALLVTLTRNQLKGT